MRPVLEMQNLEIETLCELRNGYKYGDFERFAKFLTEESVFESQWVLTPLVGKENIMEYLLALRDRQGKKIKVISVLPFPEWREKWNEDEIRRQDEIMRRSDKVTFVSDSYCKDVYLIRDRKLVDESGYCISYCNRRTGGTAYTVRYAMKKGLQVFNASSWDLSQL